MRTCGSATPSPCDTGLRGVFCEEVCVCRTQGCAQSQIGAAPASYAVLRGELRLLLHRCWFLLRGGESALQDHEVAATSGAFEGPAAPAQGLK